jgi:hypothetical protein
MDKKTEQALSQIEAAIDNPEHDADYFVGFRNGLRVAKSLIDGEPVEFESCKPKGISIHAARMGCDGNKPAESEGDDDRK